MHSIFPTLAPPRASSQGGLESLLQSFPLLPLVCCAPFQLSKSHTSLAAAYESIVSQRGSPIPFKDASYHRVGVLRTDRIRQRKVRPPDLPLLWLGTRTGHRASGGAWNQGQVTGLVGGLGTRTGHRASGGAWNQDRSQG